MKSLKEWQIIFDDQIASNMSISAYCKLHKINKSAFYNARIRNNNSVNNTINDFIKVELSNNIKKILK